MAYHNPQLIKILAVIVKKPGNNQCADCNMPSQPTQQLTNRSTTTASSLADRLSAAAVLMLIPSCLSVCIVCQILPGPPSISVCSSA